MSLLDFIVILVGLLVGHFFPILGGWSTPVIIIVLLVIERLLRGEKI